MIIEIIKLFISVLTPIAVLVVGLSINKNLEKNRINILKEKEWQVRWAELFLNQAIEFNQNLSLFVSSGFLLSTNTSLNRTDLLEQMTKCLVNLTHIQYDIRNYAQFAEENNKMVIDIISKIMLELNEVTSQRAKKHGQYKSTTG